MTYDEALEIMDGYVEDLNDDQLTDAWDKLSDMAEFSADMGYGTERR